MAASGPKSSADQSTCRAFHSDRPVADGLGRSAASRSATTARSRASAPAARTADAERIAASRVPGLPNLHCHAFQRGMAGLAERRGPATDSFWTWREVMYRFLAALTPDDVEAIAAFAYHGDAGGRLHRGRRVPLSASRLDGRPYADLGEMAARIAAAARRRGIGLTLLPSFYAYGGFGGAPPAPGQRRFINDPDRFLALVERAREIVATLAGCARRHRAAFAARGDAATRCDDVPRRCPTGRSTSMPPSRLREVEDCVAALGARPVRMAARQCRRRRALVPDPCHAHDRGRDARACARSRRGGRPLPADRGIARRRHFRRRRLSRRAAAASAIGTDSNIQIDAAAELRQLEYAQRLARRARNVMTIAEGESTGRRAVRDARWPAARRRWRGRSARSRRASAPTSWCSMPTIPTLAARSGDRWLDAWIFVAGRAAVKDGAGRRGGGRGGRPPSRGRSRGALPGCSRKAHGHLKQHAAAGGRICAMPSRKSAAAGICRVHGWRNGERERLVDAAA